MSTLKNMAQKVVLSSGLENFQSDLISENMGKYANQWSGGSVVCVFDMEPQWKIDRNGYVNKSTAE